MGAGSALSAAYYRQDKERVVEIVPASALLIGNGAFLLAFAVHRYITILAALSRDLFPLHPYGTLTAVGITSLSTLSSLYIVWSIEKSNAFNKEVTPNSRKANSFDSQ